MPFRGDKGSCSAWLVSRRINTAKSATSTAAWVATGVAGAVGSTIGTVAHVAGKPFRGKAKGRGPVTTGTASVIALVEVLDAMHDAGRNVVATGAAETATCIQYRYVAL